MDQDWNRLLSGIPREKPPEIPLERILDRSRAPQRPIMLAAAVAIVALTLIATQSKTTQADAPVHLQIEFVRAGSLESGALPESGGTLESSSDGGGRPEEFDRP